MRVMQPFAAEPINAYMEEMKATARELADASNVLLDVDTISSIDHESRAVEDDSEKQHKWRELLYLSESCWKGCAGVVLAAEALSERSSSSGENFLELLTSKGILVGTHVDTGFMPLNSFGEFGTKGDIGLDARCESYYKSGLRFGIWRSKVLCTDEMPTDVAVWDSMYRMAQCAFTCQLHGLTPVIQIEVSVEGGRQSAERTSYVVEKVLSQAMRQLSECDVNLEAVVLTTSFCRAGADAAPATPLVQGELTARAFSRSLPPALAGVRLIPQTLDPHLEAVQEQVGDVRAALHCDCWPIGFVHTENMLRSVLTAWEGKEENVTAARGRLAEALGVA